MSSESDKIGQSEKVSIEKIDEYKERFDENLRPSSTITYESHGAIIDSPMLLTLSGKQVNNVLRGREYRYIYTVKFNKNACNVTFGMLIKTISGVELGGGKSSISAKNGIDFIQAGSTFKAEFRFRCSLNPGVYFLNAGVVGDVEGSSQIFLHRLLDVEMFRVLPVQDNLSTGKVDFSCYPEIELL
jgi:lipopolysaccharide transport system ATP-binding protein